MAASNKEHTTCEENGVKLRLPEDKKKSELLKIYNPKLCMLREAVLGSLSLMADQLKKQIQCLDAIAASGVSGVLWKRSLGGAVNVISADRNTDLVKSTCVLNDITVSDWMLNPARFTGERPSCIQGDEEIHVCPFPANVLMHYEAFNFIYLQPNVSVSGHVDSVFANLRTDGLACLVYPYITSQCFRSPQLVLRQYHAHVMKTEYVQELAARVVIGDIARVAAKHSRGITIMYVLCIEDQFLIVVKVTKTTQAAVDSMNHVQHVLHCLMCEERVVMPDTHSPVELPYQLLPCSCKSDSPGKTAVVLGPMWTGEILDIDHIQNVMEKTMTTFPKSRVNYLLESLVMEAKCEGPESLTANQKNCLKCSTNQNCDLSCLNLADDGDQGEPAQKRQKTENDQKGVNSTNGNKEEKVTALGEGHTELSVNIENTSNSELKHRRMPLFYYNLHRQKHHGVPKVDRIVTMLRRQGYRASRTQFDQVSIRTDATVLQLQTVVKKYISIRDERKRGNKTVT